LALALYFNDLLQNKLKESGIANYPYAIPSHWKRIETPTVSVEEAVKYGNAKYAQV
jgi:hypothetical protein